MYKEQTTQNAYLNELCVWSILPSVLYAFEHITSTEIIAREHWSSGQGNSAKPCLFVFAQITDFCPPDTAVCLKNESKYINLGEVSEGLRREIGVFVLKYINGEKCPDQIRRKSTIIRLLCDEDRIVSMSQRRRFYNGGREKNRWGHTKPLNLYR